MEMNQDNPHEEVKEDQITNYHADIHQIELEGYELGVKKARNALFWAAGLILLAEVIVYARSGIDPEPIGISFIVGIVGSFLGLALWTKKKPFTAIVSGLILFIAYILFVAIINGYVDGFVGVLKGLFGGWLFKILIFVALIRPLKDAKELQKIKEENEAR